MANSNYYAVFNGNHCLQVMHCVKRKAINYAKYVKRENPSWDVQLAHLQWVNPYPSESTYGARDD